jgi:hypothetical protein
VYDLLGAPIEPPPLTDHMRFHLVAGLRALLAHDTARIARLRHAKEMPPAYLQARAAIIRADLAELGARA